MEQCGFEGLLLGTAREMAMCLRAAFGSITVLARSSRPSEHTWGKCSLSKSAVPLLMAGSQLNFHIAVPPPGLCLFHLPLFSLSGHLVR